MKPKRIQRKRTKGWRMPPNTIYVGRPSRWGNPWEIGDNLHDIGCAPEEGQPVNWRTCITAADCVQGFRQFVDWEPPTFEKPWRMRGGTPEEPTVMEMWGGYDDNIHINRRSIRKFLAGKDLCCWCPLDQPCHADVLLEIANQGTERE